MVAGDHRPLSLVILATLMVCAGGAGALGSVWLLVQAVLHWSNDTRGSEFTPAFFLVLAVIAAVPSLATVMVAWGLWRGTRWGWVAALVLAGCALVSALLWREPLAIDASALFALAVAIVAFRPEVRAWCLGR